jgi:hypothetical protein
MVERLDRKLIEANWDDVQRVIKAFRNRVVAPSLILRKLGTTPRQNRAVARNARDRAHRAHCPQPGLDRGQGLARGHD